MDTQAGGKDCWWSNKNSERKNDPSELSYIFIISLIKRAQRNNGNFIKSSITFNAHAPNKKSHTREQFRGEIGTRLREYELEMNNTLNATMLWLRVEINVI